MPFVIDLEVFWARLLGTFAATVLIFLVGAMYGVARKRIGDRRRIRQLLDFTEDRPIHIVISTPLYIDPTTGQSITTPGVPLATLGTVIGYKKLAALLRRAYPKSEFVELFASNDFPATFYGDNLVLIGFPKTNQATKAVLEELRPPITFADHDIVDSRTGESWTAAIKDRQITKDCGFVLRANNPFNPRGSRVLILAGSQTYGIKAASEYFDPDNLLPLLGVKASKTLGWIFMRYPFLIPEKRKNRDFQVVVESTVNQYFTSDPKACAYRSL
jgi:hypothetical protein